MKVKEITTLNMENPLGIDVTPYFSWKIESEEPGTLQTAYQVQVWDEEKKVSDPEKWSPGNPPLCPMRGRNF